MNAEEATEALERLIELAPPLVSADARIEGGVFGTMRFANGWLHQPHLESISQLSLRVALGRRLATVTTTDLGRTGLVRAMEEALSLARAAPEEVHFAGFGPPEGRAPTVPYSRATATLSPEEQARWAQRLIESARERNPLDRISGVVHTGGTFLAVANSRGRRALGRRSIFSSRLLIERLALDPPGSGWSEAAHYDHRALRPERIAREASERVPTRPPGPMPPGRYRTLLDGPAAAKLVFELGWLGFTARGWEDGSSCLRHRRGRRIAPPGFTVIDDARSPSSLPQSVDAEGMIKRPTPLISSGIAEGPTLDLLSAARLGLAPTGHAWPPEAPWGMIGATPQNQVVRPGEARSLEELIRETRRGVLVTRFHYVRTVQPGDALLTGMTRDGTYRIERGEVAGPVRNLRFTESALAALRRLELWGRERRCYTDDDERGAVAVTAPPMLTGAFRFTSATVF